MFCKCHVLAVHCNFILFFKGKNTATETVDVPKGKELIGYKVHDLVNMASVEVTGYDENGEKVAGFTVSRHLIRTMTYELNRLIINLICHTCIIKNIQYKSILMV